MAELIDEDETTRTWANRLRESSTKMTGQLGNWTMIANGAGIAFLLTAVRDRTAVSDINLALPYVVLLAGLILGFIGHLPIAAGLNQMASNAMKRTRLIQGKRSRKTTRTELVLAGEEVPAELEEADKNASAKLEKMDKTEGALLGAGTLCYVFAAVAAGTGLAFPLITHLI